MSARAGVVEFITTKDIPVNPDAVQRLLNFPYVRLLRFHFHQNFLVVVLGTLFFDGPSIGFGQRAVDLIAMYFSFNIGLYGGIYTMNGIADAELDAQDPFKRTRPVASGEVSKMNAAIFTACLYVFAFASSHIVFGNRFHRVFALFLLVNVLYSFVFRRVKALRAVFAATTSPMRLLLGSQLALTHVSWPCLIMAYLFMTAVHLSRLRMSENNRFLSFSEIACLAGTALAIAANYPHDMTFLGIVVLCNVVYIVLPGVSETGYHLAKRFYVLN